MSKTRVPSMDAIINNVIEAIIAIDENGDIQYANPSVEKMFGYPCQELLGKSIELLVPEPEAGQHRRAIREYLRTGQTKVIGTTREACAKRRDGSVFPVHLSVGEGRREGNKIFFTGVIRDMSELMRYQGDLRRNNEFISAVLNTVRSLVIVLDRRGRVVNFNRAFEEMTGRTLEEVAGKSLGELFLDPVDRSAATKNFLCVNIKQPTHHFEAVWRTADGQKRTVAWVSSFLFDKKNSLNHIIGTGVDITERRQLEAMVQESAKNERKKLGEELHDGIAQHLTSTALVAKILEKKLERVSSPGAVGLKKIVGMINQAIAETRELAQGLYAGEAKADLTSLLKKMAQETRRALGIHCAVRVGRVGCRLDDGQVRQLYRIAREALSNAVKHGHCKHIWIRLKKINTFECELRIENDGKRFSNMARKPGLGLRMLHSRAVMLNAVLEIRPRARGGTVVRCVFPAVL